MDFVRARAQHACVGVCELPTSIDRTRERHCAALIRAGESESAVQELQALLADDGRRAWAHAHLGDLLSSTLGDHTAALYHLTRAVDLQPDYAWALAHRGGVFERLDRFEEAEVDLRHALALEPSKVWAHAMLCRVHQFCGRYERAIEELEEVIRIDVAVMPDWRAERGLLQMLAGRHELAHSLYLEALVHDPRDRLATYNIAINQRHWQGLEAGQTWVARARELLLQLPAGNRTTYELGGLFALEGRVEQALEQLAAAIEAERGRVLLSPSFKRARVDLAWSSLRSDSRFGALTRCVC